MQDPIAHSEPEDEDLHLLDIALVLAANWRSIILLPLLAGVIALGISFLVSPTYTASTRMLPPAQQQSTAAMLSSQLNSLSGLFGGAGTLKNPADQYVALLKSRTVTDALIERFQLRTLYNLRYIEDTRNELEARTRITAGPRDGIVTIAVEDADPRRAAEIANAFVDELRRLSRTLAITEAAQRRLFFEEQLTQTKENLRKAEISLRGSAVSEATLRAVPQSALEALARLLAQITAQEIRLSSMGTFMTDTNPEFKLALQELSALRAELAKVEKSNAAKAMGDGAEYIAKYRDFKYHEALFELMAKQYEIARLDESREGAVIQIVDAALPPERRTRPKRALTAVLTTLASAAFMVFFVFARHAVRRMTEQPETAEKLARLRRLISLRGA